MSTPHLSNVGDCFIYNYFFLFKYSKILLISFDVENWLLVAYILIELISTLLNGFKFIRCNYDGMKILNVSTGSK